MLRWLVVLICMLQIMPAVARMYQWNDPVTGTTQLSGTPPAWYRSGDDSPRVFVFERGRVIDDTGVPVSDEHRIFLRQQAFLQTEEDTQSARIRVEQAERMRVLLERPQMLEHLARIWEQLESTESLSERQPSGDRSLEAWQDSVKQQSDSDLSPAQIEELRNLISAWETEQARALRRMLMPEGELPAQPEAAPDDVPEPDAP